MKGKRLWSIFVMLVMLLAAMPAMPASAEASINIGDYIQMGTYYGEPILWRCVSFDKISGYDTNGNPIIDSTDTRTTYVDGYLPLMLSDKIICLKPFDASGTNTSGSHGRGYYDYGTPGYWRQHYGSNYWADSNIRDWLNSTASAGNVIWSCGNPPDNDHVFCGYNDYADEAGFLTNFTQGERNAIKEVTQKSLLDGYEYSDSSNTINSGYHRYKSSIISVVQNYDSAFSEQVTDRMFLPDIKQINAVYNNSSILGDRYYVGEPTAQCVSNSEYTDSSLKTEKKWYALLRSPAAKTNFSGGYIRDVTSDAYSDDYVNVCDAHNGRHGGVRPAFYLNTAASFTSGCGTESDPYHVTSANNNHTDYQKGLNVITNEPTRSVLLGNSFLIGAIVIDEDGNNGDLSGIRFSVEDGDKFGMGDMYEEDGILYCRFNAKQTGTTKIKVSDTNTGQTADIEFTVEPPRGNAYTINNVPVINYFDQDGGITLNFINHGLYIDSFDKKVESNGDAKVSFNVYNTLHTYGTIEVYDSDDKLINSKFLKKKSYESSIVDTAKSGWALAKTIHNFFGADYRLSSTSAETKIEDLEIPAGGYIKICNDPNQSALCSIINGIDLLCQYKGLIGAFKSSDKDAVPEAVITKINKASDEFNQKWQKKFAKSLINKFIDSDDDAVSFAQTLNDLLTNDEKMAKFVVEVLKSSAVGFTEANVEDWFEKSTSFIGATLKGMFIMNDGINAAVQTNQFSKLINNGCSIKIQAPYQNKRVCTNVTAECNMEDSVALDVYTLNITDLKKYLPSIENANSQNISAEHLSQNQQSAVDIIAGYDISLWSGGIEYSNNGKVKVTIAVPPEYKNYRGDVSVYRVEPNGSVTKLDGVFDGTCVIFYTDHFSEYILTASEYENAYTTDNGILFTGDDGSVATAFTADMENVWGSVSNIKVESGGLTKEYLNGKHFNIPTRFTGTNVVLGIIVNNLNDTNASVTVNME